MAPGQIARNQKPTGSVEGSCFRKLERKSTRQSLRLSKKPAPKESNIKISEDGHKGELEPSSTYYIGIAKLNIK